MFDRIFVAGQAAIDRYAQKGVVIPAEKFRIVGRPQVASIEPARGRIWDLTDKVVLYAPTWTGSFNDTNYCSLPVAEPLLRELLEHKATVILRAHPYTSKNRQSMVQLARLEAMLAEDQAASGRPHIWGTAADTDMSLVECFNRSDALVADVSSVVSDYLYSGKPFAITDITGAAEAFAENFPLAKAAYVLNGAMSNAADVVTSLLETDPADEVRQSMRSYYLGDFPKDRYEDVFVEEARRYL
jgi:CDP-glycerol glycerophosphotransferase (TagB/SpsB family)